MFSEDLRRIQNRHCDKLGIVYEFVLLDWYYNPFHSFGKSKGVSRNSLKIHPEQQKKNTIKIVF